VQLAAHYEQQRFAADSWLRPKSLVGRGLGAAYVASLPGVAQRRFGPREILRSSSRAAALRRAPQ